MSRLNSRAYKLLKVEVYKRAKEDLVGEAGKKIVMKRLDKLRFQSGETLKIEELSSIVKDQFPNFSDTVIQKAIEINKPSQILSKIMWIPAALVGMAGIVWVANLPYPMIRKPVSRVAPIVLLPSYINMDYNYREAIANIEQADQLINKATSSADINLGANKVALAQKHLNELPVWFLDFYPKRYCTFFSCSWKFTLDEFETARKQVGRMQAKVFQENNAQTFLAEAEQTIATAKQQYLEATTSTEKQQAIANWQSGIDRLAQIPPTTVAKKIAQPQLAAAKRDFEKEVGLADGNKLSFTFIEVAKKFGLKAAEAAQNGPHSDQRWQVIVDLWEQAINQLQKISADNPSYLAAQSKIAEYQLNLANVKMRLQAERDSGTAFKRGKDLIADWKKSAINNSDRGLLASKLQEIINQLENVKPETTFYQQAQELLKFAKDKQKNL
ncbi:MAG: hypothetical protein O4861_09600 [Trichodesmium sp. St16_bin4-tuft]|nr:hypothetical protein [Trichodesmium sp. St4_bin8_1]MDE5071188.1 hypothetical protein [Trichodesmium sp. St5_bin8]MDE5092432.1 hypothetical protein [Trichodesmium sp. St18_bin3_1_1]MDE5098575.1 hypothetical protein [Trichodesmium sp. St16_bin4-tuft]MDE5102214.1 hypothetical protein [Trichodesmium sp. St19_bin2]